MSDLPLTRMQTFEQSHEIGRNPSPNPTLEDIVAHRFGRRDVLTAALASALAASVSPLVPSRAAGETTDRFKFIEVEAGSDGNHRVADGYEADILIRWGDPVLPHAPAFDPHSQSAAAQKKQFGYNSDYLGYIAMPDAASPAHHGLLVVNHEYTNEELMFPGLRQQNLSIDFNGMTARLVAIEMAAHGGSVLEVKRENGKWGVVPGSRYARRIDADTPMEITGPAAGICACRPWPTPVGATSTAC